MSMLTTQLVFHRFPLIALSRLAAILLATFFNCRRWSRILVLLPERVSDDRHDVGIYVRSSVHYGAVPGAAMAAVCVMSYFVEAQNKNVQVESSERECTAWEPWMYKAGTVRAASTTNGGSHSDDIITPERNSHRCRSNTTVHGPHGAERTPAF